MHPRRRICQSMFGRNFFRATVTWCIWRPRRRLTWRFVRSGNHRHPERDFSYLHTAMGCQAGVGCLDGGESLLQVFAGSRFERPTAFQAINEVSQGCVDTISAISIHLIIRPNLLLPGPDFPQPVYSERARVSLK